MKKIATLLFAAGLMLGASSSAQAVDIKMSGQFDFTAGWSNAGMDSREGVAGYNAGGQNNAFYQRLRTQIDIIASESLRGVVMFEIGDTVWGRSAAGTGDDSGGGIGSDGVSIKVKNAYLDWIVPHTELQVRMGLQEFVLPGMDGSTQVFNDDVAGIVMNYAFTPEVGLTAWWIRPYSDNSDNYTASGRNSHANRMFNELDMFGLAVPLTFEGVNITPWAQYAVVGRDFFQNYDGATSPNHSQNLLPRWAPQDNAEFRPDKGQGNAWWLGLTGDVTVWDPFRFAWDVNYGSVDMGNAYYDGAKFDAKRSGWIVALLAEYSFDFVTPGLIFWYGSGDDSDWRDGSEMMPSLHASSNFTSFGQDGAAMNFFGTAFESGIAGTWGLTLRFNDISFIEDLTHTVQIAYYRGTNSTSMTTHKGGVMSDPWMNGRNDSGDAYTYLTDKDSAWEFNLTNIYNIYENLQLGVDLGYIKLDLSESAWGRNVKNREEDAWKVGVGLCYTF